MGRRYGNSGRNPVLRRPERRFVAVDERDGKVLWHFPTNEIIKSSPMTYTVNGKQFVAIAAGPSIVSFGLP